MSMLVHLFLRFVYLSASIPSESRTTCPISANFFHACYPWRWTGPPLFFDAVTTQLVASWCFSMYERCYHLAVTYRIIRTRVRTMCVRLQLSPSGEVNMAYVPTSTSVPAAGGFIPTQSLVPDGLSRRPSATHPPVFVSPSLHYVLRHICIAFHVYFV